jgi:hypothetical protein
MYTPFLCITDTPDKSDYTHTARQDEKYPFEANKRAAKIKLYLSSARKKTHKQKKTPPRVKET